MSHPNRAEINRANSLHSTGPQTDAGKKKSSHNAIRHGLTGQVVVLPAEDMAAYLAFSRRFFDDFKPRGIAEEQFVQTLADTAWRMNRCTSLENGIFANGHAENRRHVHTHDAEAHAVLVAGLTCSDQSRQLVNLSLYEQRLNRIYNRTFQALQTLQQQRKAAEHAQIDTAANIRKRQLELHQDWTPVEDGFVFSTPEIDAYIRRRDRLANAAGASASSNAPRGPGFLASNS